MIIKTNGKNNRKIYLAGGCFWGVEAYFKKITGILNTKVGYANGSKESISYDEVCSGIYGFAEVVEIQYDDTVVSTEEILLHYLRIINPYSLNKQGNDVGIQYRTGVYFLDGDTANRVGSFFEKVDKDKEFAIEIAYLENFVIGEDYHQNYLDANPQGYCHINLSKADEPLFKTKFLNPEAKIYDSYKRDKALQNRIGKNAFNITQNSTTEMAFTGEYDNFWQKGIYVDVVSGAPIFASSDKFDSGCGWPAYSRPITWEAVEYSTDTSFGVSRVEVRSKFGSHLGHVFPDGNPDTGGLRYCINSGALKFIPLEDMEKNGYGEYIPLVK